MPIPPEIPVTNVLSVHDLWFSYPKSSETLFSGLTHDFTPGKLTAVTGPSGCGKSTLLYILGLMLRPTRGQVEFGSRVLSSDSNHNRAKARASTLGLVFQDAALDPTRTILDLVIEPALYGGFSRKDAVKRAMGLLEMTEVSYRAMHKPGQISGGQAQRVALARALVSDPPVVLADEPTGNLDQTNAQIVLDILHSQAREGRTVIVVTHDPVVAANADVVLRLTVGGNNAGS